MSDMECPYCGAEQEVCHDDGAGYAEDQLHEHYCSECDKLFVFETWIKLNYFPKKAECLNDGNHDWKPSFTIPIEQTKGVCSVCHTERRATPEDMKAAHEYRAELDARAALKGAET